MFPDRYLSPEAYQFAVRRVERDKPTQYLRSYKYLLKEWNRQKLAGGSLDEEIRLIAWKETVYLRLKNRFSRLRGEEWGLYRKDQVPSPDSPVWDDIPVDERFCGEESHRELTPLWMVLHYFDVTPENAHNSWLLRTKSDSNVDRMTRRDYYKLIKSTAEKLRLELIRLRHSIWRDEEDTLPRDSSQFDDYLLRAQRKIAQLESRDANADVSNLSNHSSEMVDRDAPIKDPHVLLARGKIVLNAVERDCYDELSARSYTAEALVEHFERIRSGQRGYSLRNVKRALRKLREFGLIANLKDGEGYFRSDKPPTPMTTS